MDARLEVAVAAQHGRDHQAVVLDRLRDRIGQRPAVANARGAAIADHVELQRLEVGHQPGPPQIVGHHSRAWRQTRFYRRTDAQPFFNGLLGQQPGADHDQRIGRVGAAGDRGDGDRAVLHVRLATAHFDVELLWPARLDRQLGDGPGVGVDHLDGAVAIGRRCELGREGNADAVGDAA